MKLLDRLRRLFSPPASSFDNRSLHVRVRCRRCGEILTTRVDLLNELSASDDGGFVAHKLVSGSGSNRCFQVIELTVRFNNQRRPIEQTAVGGEVVRDEVMK